MESAAPDPAARLLTVVDAVAARAEEARRRLDALTVALDELLLGVDGNGEPPPRPATPASADPVRLAAIELAVSGLNRSETAARLQDHYPGAELDAVLNDVFGDIGV
jgi:hypothetical protein